MLDFASMLKGIKPAPIPGHLVRSVQMDKRPPRIILEIEEEKEPQEDEAAPKLSGWDRAKIRHATVLAVVATSGKRGMRRMEVSGHLPYLPEHLIAASLEWLLLRGKLRTVPREPNKGAIYWDAAQ